MEAKATSPRPGANRRAAAFTLTELATVMVMIALAAGMLLGLLTTPGRRARALKCINNQKVMMGGIHQYTTQMRTYPLNYSYYGTHKVEGKTVPWPRWALGGLSGFVSEVRGGPGDLRCLHEGEFPKIYICPAASLKEVYTANFAEKYHACYWTNIAVRVNRGWGVLLGDYSRTGQPPGWDVDSTGEARFFGKLCPNVGRHWRSVYMPAPDFVSNPSGVVFTGDTNDKAYRGGHNTLPGQFHMRPGWGHVHGFLGFSRHGGSIALSYLDGHAGTFTEKQLREHSFFPAAGGGKEATGDFMFKFVGEDGCTADTRGHHDHNFAPKHGEKE